jgi:zeta-carotene desaturase
MGVPALPLTELYNAAGDYIRARGGEVRFRSSVDAFRANDSQVVLCSGGQEESFNFVVLAVPFQIVSSLLPSSTEAEPLRRALQHFESSPITGIHLWLDREISDLDHAVLLDRTIQWMFHKSRILRRSTGSNGSYVELVVSASKSLVDKSRGEIVDLAVKELSEFFPAAQEAKLVKSTVIKEIHATYSPQPGIDAFRPPSATSWSRVFLAGDWIATAWPATMEGAVRSGYLVAESVSRAAGIGNPHYLAPDLPPTGLMRFFR